MTIKNEGKKPIIPIIVASIITVIILIGAFQVFWYGPLKGKYTEVQKQLAEKKAIITDIRTLLEETDTAFRKFKLDATRQYLEMTEITKALTKKKSRLSAIIKKNATRWNSFEGNICNDENIIPDTLKWAKAAETEIENEKN